MDPESISSLFLYLSVTTFSVTDYFLIALLIIFILINTFISGSEVAFFSLDTDDIDSLKNSSSPTKGHLLESLAGSDRLLASILVSYNVLNVAIVTLIIYLLRNIPSIISSTRLLVMLYLLIVVLLVLFIEIIPKLYALHNPLKVAQRHKKE